MKKELVQSDLPSKFPNTIQKYHIRGKWYFRMVFGTFLSLGRSVEFFKFCHFQLYLLCIEKIDFKSTIICHFEKNQIQSFQTLPDPVSQLPTSADISPSLIDLDLYRHCLTIFIQMMIMTADLRLQWSCRWLFSLLCSRRTWWLIWMKIFWRYLILINNGKMYQDIKIKKEEHEAWKDNKRCHSYSLILWTSNDMKFYRRI